jgi:hypothetical protein
MRTSFRRNLEYEQIKHDSIELLKAIKNKEEHWISLKIQNMIWKLWRYKIWYGNYAYSAHEFNYFTYEWKYKWRKKLQIKELLDQRQESTRMMKLFETMNQHDNITKFYMTPHRSQERISIHKKHKTQNEWWQYLHRTKLWNQKWNEQRLIADEIEQDKEAKWYPRVKQTRSTKNTQLKN